MTKLFETPAVSGMQSLFTRQYKLTPNSPHGWRVVCWGTPKILIDKEKFNPKYHFIQHYTEYQAAVARFFDTVELHQIEWKHINFHDNGLEAATLSEYYFWQVAIFDGRRFLTT